MSIKYDSKREPLSEIIKRATVNATYVVPDLQRPYVWTPRQVTLLIDSLFRGWPFGSLLIWEVKPDCFEANEGIPHRPFWQVVDRTSEDTGSTASALGQPATYHMVLDGQQRIQSLILALGGDQWGFKMNDADWALDLQERRVRPTNHWSRGSLCIDLDKFRVEVDSKAGKVRKIEAEKILEWVARDKTTDHSPELRQGSYLCPLPNASDNPGRFIRLSRIWDLAQKDLSEEEYEEQLKPVFDDHKVSKIVQDALLSRFAQFMRVVENVKNNSFVHALQIESFQLTKQWTKDDYSDAIVNIFTRLNTAGRTLTREEITLAWLKVGWIPKATNGKSAGQCLKDLQDALADSDFQLDTDEIVRLISFVWSVEHRDGNLLDSKDLLKGEIVRSVATNIAERWNQLQPHLKRGAELVRSRGLPVKSFNAVIVVLTWLQMVFTKFDGLPGLTTVARDDLEKHLLKRAEQFVDRWSLASEWAGIWADAAGTNFQNIATDLNAISKSVQSCDVTTFLDVVDQSTTKLMDRVVQKAAQSIDNFGVKERRRVHEYHNLLWLWHRLDSERWKCSSVPVRTGRKRTSKLEVDHTIADAWWQRTMNDEIDTKLKTFAGTEEEKLTLGPNGFNDRWDAQAYVNNLGNCSLLEKSFNISKSDAPMWDFLKEVHEFKHGTFVRATWQAAILLDDSMTMPTGKTLADLKALIQARDVAIRSELKEFVQGKRTRVDLQPTQSLI